MQRKPIFARFRSARLYVLVTVCVSLFTDVKIIRNIKKEEK